MVREHTRLLELLASDRSFQEAVIGTFIQGSYRRATERSLMSACS